MRVVEIVRLSMKYNELLLKFAKGQKWLDNPNISTERKEKFLPKWTLLLDEIDKLLEKFENSGITFSREEVTEVIELPETLKRQTERTLEKYYNDKKEEYEKEEEYLKTEREGIQSN